MIALHEIWCFKRSVDLLMPLLPFQQLVHEIAQDGPQISEFHYPGSTGSHEGVTCQSVRERQLMLYT